MKLPWSRYSKAELKDRWVKFRYRRHRYFAWMPVVVTDNNSDGGRIRRHLYWFAYVDRRLHLGRWSYDRPLRDTKTLEELVRSSEPAPSVNPHEP
jgi:hypothetical protein